MLCFVNFHLFVLYIAQQVSQGEEKSLASIFFHKDTRIFFPKFPNPLFFSQGLHDLCMIKIKIFCSK